MPDSTPLVSEVRKIRLRRIKSGSLFKFVLLSAAGCFGPLFLFFGVLALFGANTVTVSGRHMTGLGGLISAIVMAPIFTLIFGLFAWVGAYIGIWVAGRFWRLEIEYVSADEIKPAAAPEPPPPAHVPGSGQEPPKL